MESTTTSDDQPALQLQHHHHQIQRGEEAQSESVSLLREWSYSPRNNATATAPPASSSTAVAAAAPNNVIDIAQGQHASSQPHPEVVAIAPAVVIRDDSNGSATPNRHQPGNGNSTNHSNNSATNGDSNQRSSSPYSYPVATYVSNTLQSFANHISTGIHTITESIHDDSHHHGSGDNDTMTSSRHRIDTDDTLADQVHRLSIRSAPESSSVATTTNTVAAAGAAHATPYTISIQTDNAATRNSVSERTHNLPSQQHGEDAHLDDADFVLVDGEMIQLPSPPSRYDFDEDADEFHRKNCKSKGFKRFRKWVKKRALGPRHKGMKGTGAGENISQSKSERSNRGRKKDHRRGNRRRMNSASSTDLLDNDLHSTATTGGTQSLDTATTEAPRQYHQPFHFDHQRQHQQPPLLHVQEQRQQEQQQQQQMPLTPAAGMSYLHHDQMPLTPAAGLPPPPPPSSAPPFPSPPPQEASFVGTTDQLLQAGVLPGPIALYASAYIEGEDDDIKADDVASTAAAVNCAAATAMAIGDVSQQQKIDKVETLLLEEQIQQYQQQQREDEQEETSSDVTLSRAESSSAKTVPLSRAIESDTDVYNDTLKVVMVGSPHVGKSSLVRALRDKSPKKNKKRKRASDRLSISVNTWLPPPALRSSLTTGNGDELSKSTKNDRHNGDNTSETGTISSVTSYSSLYPPPVERPIKFSIWDVNEGANSGTHPSTQSLFYSEGALYVLVWDMAVSNAKTFRRKQQNRKKNQKTDDGYGSDDSDFSSDDDDDYDDDDYIVEEANRLADRALEIDIEDRVLSWVNSIASTNKNTAILPVVTMPEDHDDSNGAIIDEEEARRRCSTMQMMIMQALQSLQQDMNGDAPKLVGDGIFRLDSNTGIVEIQQAILAVAAPSYLHSCDTKEGIHESTSATQLFPHVGSPVQPEIVFVLQCIRRLREDDQKVVLVEQIVAETGLCLEDVIGSLQFLSSIGELLYFGSAPKVPRTTSAASETSSSIDVSIDILSRFVVLSRKWLVSALSCILQHTDLKHEIAAVRTFMNMQCEYSGQCFIEDDVTRTLLKGSNSNCPIISSTDASMLWMERSFMTEAASRTTETAQVNTTLLPESMYEFLEQLLVRYGVFLPIKTPEESNTTPVYFIPSLLSSADSKPWTYKSSDSWMTTLCHSWLLRDGPPSSLMEHITVSILQDIYDFAHSFDDGNSSRNLNTPASLDSSMLNEPTLPVGRISIRQIMCWKNSLFVSIGYLYKDQKSAELRESVSEFLVALVDQHSDHCVASNSMGGGMKRLIVCGKGQVGHHGRKLWNGGYRRIIDSVKVTIADIKLANVDRQVVCPECLAQSHASVASTWTWDSVRSANMSGKSDIICMSGHRVDANLLCGTVKPQKQVDVHRGTTPSVPVTLLLKSVVVVGLWDNEQKAIRNIGSGFIADKKQGLVVTAAHILFQMGEGYSFGQANDYVKNAKAVVGIIPGGGNTAVFRYMAEIVAHDISSVDACVLRISAKFENDVGGEGEDCANQKQIPLSLSTISEEKLQHLKLTKKYELEESIRIIGFNQGGEGLLQEGNHVNRSVDVTIGYICKNFKALPDDSSSSDDRPVEQMKLVTRRSFIPREEIVAMCPTINGHSGGPCVNAEGKVLGILSRADPADHQRCYLVPATELKSLLTDAKSTFTKRAIVN